MTEADRRFCKPCSSRSRMYLRLVVALLLCAGALAGQVPAYGMGGDLVSGQFPFRDSRIRKQEARGAAIDGSGNVIMVGYQNTGAGIDDDYDIVKILADGSTVAWRAAYNRANASDQAVAVVVDANNDVIVTGNVWNGSNSDIYTVKYRGTPGGATAEVIWAHTYSGTGSDYAAAIALDTVNNVVYVAGYSQSGSSDDDCLLLKYDNASPGPNNPPLRVIPYSGAAGGADRLSAVAANGGGVVATGYSWNGTDFDVLTLQYDQAGNYLRDWRRGSTATGDDRGKFIRLDGAGNVIVAGHLAGANGADIYTAKYSGSTGTLLWEASHNGGFDDKPGGLYVDGAGDVYVTGHVSGLPGVNKIYTVKYRDSGSTAPLVVWESVFDQDSGSTGTAVGIAVNEAPDGGVFIAGYGENAGLSDIQTIKYHKENGHLLWQRTYNGPANRNDRPVAVGMVSPASLFVAGWSDMTAPLDGGQSAATGGSATTLQNGARSWSANQWSGYWVMLTSGANSGSFRQVQGNDATTLTLSVSLANPVVAGDTYYLYDKDDLDFLLLKYEQGELDPPSNLSATALTDTEIKLTWEDNSRNESGFRIDRKIGKYGAWETDIAVLPSADGSTLGPQTFTDGGRVSNNFYYYRVRAYRDSGTTAYSDYSNEAHALTRVVTYEAPEWSLLYNTSFGADGSEDYANAVAVGPDDQPVVTGYSMGDVNGGVNLSFDYLTLKLDRASGGIIWSDRYDGGFDEQDIARSVAVTPDNSVVVTGYSSLYSPSAGMNINSIYTLKYPASPLTDGSGEAVAAWGDKYNGPGVTDDRSTAVASATDGSGNIAVVGYGKNAAGNDDIYLIKYRPDGTRGWPPVVYNGGGNDYPTAVAFDQAANIFVAGYTERGETGTVTSTGSLTIRNASKNWEANYWQHSYLRITSGSNAGISKMIMGNSADTITLLEPFPHPVQPGDTYFIYNTDFYAAKYQAADGSLLWSDTFNSPGNGDDRVNGLAVDAAGDVYVTGHVTNSAGNRDFYTIKYAGGSSVTGQRLWERWYDGPVHGDDEAAAVGVDPIDNQLVVAGTILTEVANVVSGTPPQSGSERTVDKDFFLIRYNPAGDVVWQKSFPRPDNDEQLTAMAIDQSGNIYLAGDTSNGPYTDVLAIVFDNEGTFINALLYHNDSANDFSQASSLAVNTKGEAFIAGYTKNIAGNADYLILKKRTDFLLVPAPFTATAEADYGKVDLGWHENTPGTSFRIEKTPGPLTPLSVWTLLATVAPGNTTYQDTGLSPDTQYCYRIDAVSGSLNSRKLVSCATTSLPAPVLAALQVVSASRIDLSWGNVSGNSGYKVERKSGTGGAWSDLGTTAADVTAYGDTGLTPGQLYFYRVRTRNAAGYSLPGNEQGASTRPAAPSLNPLGGATVSGLTLTWSNVAGESGYRVERKEGAAGSWVQVATTAADVTTLADGSLAANTLYFYRVIAYNASGDSLYSNEQSASTLLPPPVLTSIAAISQSQINLGWSDLSGETGYAVEESSCGDRPDICLNYPNSNYWTAWVQVATAGANATTYQRTGLSHSTHYRYRVRGVAGAVSSLPGNELLTQTWFAPNTLSLSPVSETALNLHWSFNGGVQYYDVERKTGTGGTYAVISSQVTPGWIYGNDQTDPGLGLQTLYCYRVRAYSSVATAPPPAYSNEACMTTPLPAPVLNPLTVVSTSRIDLSWNNVNGNNGYEVWRAILGSPDNPENAGNPAQYLSFRLQATVGQNVTTFSDTGLVPGNTYRYMVRDIYTGGYSAYSNQNYATTICPAPVMSTPTPVSASRIDLSWINDIGETSFLLEWKEGAGGTWSAPITVAENVATYSHTGLNAGTTYYYRVRAANAYGISAYSGEVSRSTLLAPPVLNAPTVISAARVDLSWGNVAGNTGYRVERKSGASGSWVQVGTTSANVTAFSDTTVAAGTQYFYRVSAQNAGGYSQPSNEQSTVTTPAATVVTAAAAGDSSVELSWPVVPGATDYTVEQRLASGGPWGVAAARSAPYTLSYCGSTYPSVACPAVTADVLRQPITGLGGATSYCYQVKSANATGGDSVPSAEVCVKTMAGGPPALTATALTPYRVRLDWTPGAGGGTPDGYLVEAQTFSGGFERIATVAGSVTTFTDTAAVLPDTAYTYRVRPYKGVVDDFSGGINGALWNQRGVVRNSTNVAVYDVTAPPINIVDPVNGTARVSAVSGQVELITSTPGGGQTASYNISRILLKNPENLPGEFDAVVDFALPHGIVGNPIQYEVYGRFQVSFPNAGGGTDYVYVQRQPYTIGGAILLNGVLNYQEVAMTALSGKMRLSKRDGKLSTFAWVGNGWQSLLSLPYAGGYAANYAGITQHANRSEAIGMRVQLDNFEVLDYQSAYSNEASVRTPAYAQGVTSCDQ